MRKVFLIFIGALLICVLFIREGEQLVDETGVKTSWATGKVLGASERAVDLSLADLLGVERTLPQAKPEPIREPNRKKAAAEFALNHGYGYVIDMESGQALFAQDEDTQVPIASITKLATALVFLDVNPGWDEYYTIKPSDIVNGGRIYIEPGEKIKIRDLFNLSLTASANSATRAMVSATGLSQEEFISLINKKVQDLGLTQTYFSDVVGLNNYSMSTAKEVAILSSVAMANEDIAAALSRSEYEFSPAPGKKRLAKTTNNLLTTFNDLNLSIIGGKTGYTQAAGYCLVSKFKTKSDGEFLTVILGGAESWDRFNETKELARWTYDSYEW